VVLGGAGPAVPPALEKRIARLARRNSLESGLTGGRAVRILTTLNYCLETVGPVRWVLSELALKNLEEFADFQAEYEGSIPFTRSNKIKHLSYGHLLVWTRMLLLIWTNLRLLFARRAASTRQS
jgi:hypothetical protein